MTPDTARMFLGVPSGADERALKAARNVKAKLLHPDRQAGSGDGVRAAAEDHMKHVNEAYDVLVAELRSGGPRGHGRPADAPAQERRTAGSTGTRGVLLLCLVCGADNDVPLGRDARCCGTCATPLFRVSCGSCAHDEWVWGIGAWQCGCGRVNANLEVLVR